MQRQVDRDDCETLRSERAGDRKRIGAIARDAVLIDDDRPARGWLGLAGARIRNREDERNRLRRGRHRERIAIGQVGRRRIETEVRALRNVRTRQPLPPFRQRRERIVCRWRRQVIRHADYADIDVGNRRQACAEIAEVLARRRQDDGRGIGLFDHRIDGLQHDGRRLRRHNPRQCNRSRRDARRSGRGFLRIDQLAQRLELARFGRRQRRQRRLTARAQRIRTLGQQVRQRRTDCTASRVADARREHGHVRRHLIERTRRHDRDRSTARIGRRQRDDIFLRRSELAHDSGHAAAGSAEVHLEHTHAVAGDERSRIDRSVERRRPRRRRAEPVERIHRDLGITAVGRVDDRNIERQIRAAEQKQIVRKRNHTGRRIETRDRVELDRRGVVVGAGIANGAHGEERGRDGRSRDQADLHGGTFGARGDQAS